MTDEECIEAYRELSGMLESNLLGWVAQEVDALVAVGKTEIREVAPVSAAEERDLLAQGRLALPSAQHVIPPARSRGRGARFVATVEYPPAERLRLLIQATRTAIKDTADMELAVANELIDSGIASAEIERPDGRDPWTISETEAQSRARHARSLDAALQALESAV